MSDSIQTSINVAHLNTKTTLKASTTQLVGEGAFASGIATLTTAPVNVISEGIITPATFFLNNLNSSPGAVLISVDGGGTFPMRLPPGQPTILHLDIAGRVERSVVTCVADSNGSLAGTYFDLEDSNGAVRVWLDAAAGVPEVGTIQAVADVASSLDQTYFLIYDDVGSVGVWIDVDNNGSVAPAGATAADRTLEVTGVSADDTADEVAAAIQTRLNNDSTFTATVSTDTVTVRSSTPGLRTNTIDGDTGFTFATTQQGTASTTAPATPGGGRLVPVALSLNATATAIGAAIATAFAEDVEIAASAGAGVATLEDRHPGTRADLVDGDTGFGVSTTQQGAAAPVVQIKSDSSADVLYGTFPY